MGRRIWRLQALSCRGHDGGALADALDAADIAVRAGLHCAPAVHAWLGTLQSGAIRFSPGLYNTAQEMDDTAAAAGAIIASIRKSLHRLRDAGIFLNMR